MIYQTYQMHINLSSNIKEYISKWWIKNAWCLLNVFVFDQLPLLKQFPEKSNPCRFRSFETWDLSSIWIIPLKQQQTITLNLWITVMLLEPINSVRPWTMVVSRHMWLYEYNDLSYLIAWIHHFRNTLDFIVHFGTLIRQT